MFLNKLITGSSFPDLTLCLTFDDGPRETSDSAQGPSTLDVACYLRNQVIRGTFFMTGKYASNQTEILNEVRNLGHLVANHTYHHPQLA
jgi:peptidoglycan/xylan/chitin deacetylase (PgdA/CDA1 family)